VSLLHDYHNTSNNMPRTHAEYLDVEPGRLLFSYDPLGKQGLEQNTPIPVCFDFSRTPA